MAQFKVKLGEILGVRKKSGRIKLKVHLDNLGKKFEKLSSNIFQICHCYQQMN